jgi:hypothetical protein
MGRRGVPSVNEDLEVFKPNGGVEVVEREELIKLTGEEIRHLCSSDNIIMVIK